MSESKERLLFDKIHKLTSRELTLRELLKAEATYSWLSIATAFENNVRTRNALLRAEIHTVDDLLNTTVERFLTMRNLGEGSKKYVCSVLVEVLTLGNVPTADDVGSDIQKAWKEVENLKDLVLNQLQEIVVLKNENRKLRNRMVKATITEKEQDLLRIAKSIVNELEMSQ
jgi:hypothetical protein